MNTATRSAMVLASAVLLALIVLGMVNRGTQQPIADAARQWTLDNLSAVLPEGPYDQNPVDSVRQHTASALGGSTPVDIYTVYKEGEPSAVILEVIAPDGYSGDIWLLVGIHANGDIIAARVMQHRETPGLGDDIEYRKSDWITQFNGRSLNSVDTIDWQPSRSGGQFDALSGATVTSRAVMQAIHRALLWFTEHRSEVFSV